MTTGALAAESTKSRSLWRAIGTEFLDHLPAWIYYIFAIALFNIVLTNLDPPRLDFAPTILFPLFWFVFYYVNRIIRDDELANKSKALIYIGLLSLGVPALLFLIRRPNPLSNKSLTLIYEISNYLWTMLIFWHIWRKNKREVYLFFVIAALYGVILENGGILMGYFHEVSFYFYIPPFVAPVATMVGWVQVFFMSTFFVERFHEWYPGLKKRYITSAILVAIVAVCVDLQIDPVATEVGLWRWHHTLPQPILDVPLINWFAWLYAVLPFGAAFFFLKYKEYGDDYSEAAPWTRLKLRHLLFSVPFLCVAAGILFFGTFALLEGFDGPTWVIFKAFLTRMGIL